jgi:hypothetical protein
MIAPHLWNIYFIHEKPQWVLYSCDLWETFWKSVLGLKVLLDYIMSAFLNIVFIISGNFRVSFNCKRMDFTDSLFETDDERKKDRVEFMYVRYLLTVRVLNKLITWSGKSFSWELVIFGSYAKVFSLNLYSALTDKVFIAALKLYFCSDGEIFQLSPIGKDWYSA